MKMSDGWEWNTNEGPIYQTQRMPMYSEAIEQLIEMKLAYPCV